MNHKSLAQAEVLAEIIGLSEAISQKWSSGNDRSIGKLAVTIAVNASKRAKGRSCTPFQNRSDLQSPRQIIDPAQPAPVANVVPAPPVFRLKVERVLIGNSLEVPLVRVIIPVVRQRVAGEKRNLSGIAAVERKGDCIVIRPRRAFVLSKDIEIGVGTETQVKPWSQVPLPNSAAALPRTTWNSWIASWLTV